MSWFEKLFINEAKPSLERHSGGGKEPVLEETTITTNGEHVPPEGVDGFDKVNVSVPTDVDTFATLMKHRGGQYLFYRCYTLSDEEFGQFFETVKNFKPGTSTEDMFTGCFLLKQIPSFDTSSVTSMSRMFSMCKELATAPMLNTSKVTSMGNMFYDCLKLKTIPLYDTKKVTSMSSFLSAAAYDKPGSIETIPELDMRSVTSASNFCVNQNNVTEIWIRNIKTNLQVGSATSWGHLLTLDSLIHLIRELRDTGSMKTLTVGTANLEKLTDTYVLPVEITDEMRAEDDLVDEKLPFEVVDESMEGRIPITEYVLFKNWEIK